MQLARQIVVRVPPDLDGAFRAAAAAEGLTPSQAVRALMDGYVVAAASQNDARPAARPGDAMPTPAQAGGAVHAP